MQITLQQSDIEQAIRNYVSSMGINRPVSEITFSHARKGGASTTADIVLQPLNGTVNQSISRSVEAESITITAEDATVEVPLKAVEDEPTAEVVEEEEEETSSSIFG